MKEAIVYKGPRVEIVDSPIPEPGAGQVRIRVVVSGSNPKDWKVPEWLNIDVNEGDDAAGFVDKVGSGVTEFKPGDRVAAFHEMMTPHGSYAEYAVAWAATTFHLPEGTSFEEAATIPLAAATAAVGLHVRLGLPQPWIPVPDGAPPTPLIVYGGGSAVGVFALQLARKANIHPLIAVAGQSIDYVRTLVDPARGDVVLDYRAGDEAVVSGLQKALGGRPALHALDAVSERGSYDNIKRVLARDAKLALVLPGSDEAAAAEGVETSFTAVSDVHKALPDFGFVYFRYFGRGLAEGWFRPQRHEVVPGGLDGVQGALEKLKAGKASAVKYVFRIADTRGVEK